MRKKEEYLEREMAEVSLQNKRLAEPLQRAREEMIEMQKRLANHERDKQILAVSVPLSSLLSLLGMSEGPCERDSSLVQGGEAWGGRAPSSLDSPGAISRQVLLHTGP